MFFSQNWYVWLILNLTPKNRTTQYGDWHLVFGVTIWYIWKDRCCRTFDEDSDNWFGTVLAIKIIVEDIEKKQRSGYDGKIGGTEVENIGWKYPVKN